MGLKVGGDWILYYNSATNASPTWVQVKKVGDVVLNLQVSAAEVNLRESLWNLNLPARKIIDSLDVMLATDIAGTVWEALRGFFFARTPKQYAVTNDAIATNGTQGFKFFGFLENFPINQPLSELTRGDCTIKPSYTEESSVLVEPAWFTISA